MNKENIKQLKTIYYQMKEMIELRKTKERLYERKLDTLYSLQNQSYSEEKQKSMDKLRREIFALEDEIKQLSDKLHKDSSFFEPNVPALKINNCQHEMCTLVCLLSDNPTSSISKPIKVLNYQTQEIDLLYESNFDSGEYFAYHCLDCDSNELIAVPIEASLEFESSHKIIKGFRQSPHYLQRRYYKLLLSHSFEEAYELLKKEVERGLDYEYLTKFIENRKNKILKNN